MEDKVHTVRMRPAVSLALVHVLGGQRADAEDLAAVVLVAVEEAVGQV